MVDTENFLKQTLVRIAAEQEYVDYKTELTPIHSGGANYTSQLYDVTLSAAGKDDLKLFAKVAIIGEKFRTMLTLQIFESEILFYTKVITKYRHLEEKYDFPKEDRLVVPKYYGGSIEDTKETLVLENLSKSGYQPFDRFQYISWDYTAKCIETLARFHALSVRYERDDPEDFKTLTQKVTINMPMAALKEFIMKSAAPALEATDKKYKDRLEKFFKDHLKDEVFIKYFNPERKVTLIHGDFRPSNILHKTDESGKLDIILIDFQLIQKGNPVMDLLYFLICGSDEKFRAKYFKQYFHHYYRVFSKTLLKLEINPDEVYKKQDFDADVEELLPFGIMLGVLTLPLITVDVDSAPKPEDGIDLEDFTMRPSALFRTRFNAILTDFMEMGIL